MIHKASHYVSKGMHAAKTSLKNGKTPRFLFLLYTLATTFGKLFFFSFPLFAMVDHRIIRQIKESSRVDMDDALTDAVSAKRYRTMAIGVLWNHALLLTGVLLIAGLTTGLYFLGDGFAIQSPSFSMDWGFLSISLGVLCALIVTIWVNVAMDPVIYLMGTQPDLEWTDATKQAKQMMSDAGIAKRIMISFLHLLLFLLFGFGGTYLVLSAFTSGSLVWFFVLAIPIAWYLSIKLPQIVLSNRIAIALLYEDLLEDAAYQSLFDQTVKGLPSAKIRKESLLVGLFNELFEEAKPDDEVPTLEEDR